MKFHDIMFEKMDALYGENAVRSLVKFDNGYRASIVRHDHSYGGTEGLFELAVMNSSDQIVYDTPVTSDVLGYLDPFGVEEALSKIEALPRT